MNFESRACERLWAQHFHASRVPQDRVFAVTQARPTQHQQAASQGKACRPAGGPPELTAYQQAQPRPLHGRPVVLGAPAGGDGGLRRRASGMLLATAPVDVRG